MSWATWFLIAWSWACTLVAAWLFRNAQHANARANRLAAKLAAAALERTP